MGRQLNTQKHGQRWHQSFPEDEAAAVMEDPKFRTMACNITNGHLQSMGESINIKVILGTLDRSGILHRGWAAIFKIMKNGLRRVDKNLDFKSMPNPFQMRTKVFSIDSLSNLKLST